MYYLYFHKDNNMNLSNLPDFRETFSSRVDDTRRDGPSLITGILETADNSYDWAKSSKYEVNYNTDRMIMEILDNGPDGFGSIDAIHRFFQLGETNNKVTEETIGKYGKGGYKAIICLGDKFHMTSYFHGNQYDIGTDFITMIEENKWNPTQDLEYTISPEEMVGTKFNINLCPKYQLVLNEKDMIRNFTRAFHQIEMDIHINGKKVEKVNPYGTNFQQKKEYKIIWNNGVFTAHPVTTDQESDSDSDSDPDSGTRAGTLTLYVLRDVISSYDI